MPEQRARKYHQGRVAETLRDEISTMIQGELSDPRIGSAHVTEVVLNVGGMEMDKALPEVDQINYLPRVTQPVLMLNGKYDMYFPVESSQKHLFRFLGTAPGRLLLGAPSF